MDAFMEADTFFVTAIARGPIATGHTPPTSQNCSVEQLRKFLALYSRGGTGTSLHGGLITELFGKTTSIEVRATFAVS